MMPDASPILCLDVGNSQIHAGLYHGNVLRCEFRRSTQALATADELGIFFRAALRENGDDPAAVRRVGICSVVPAALAAVRGCAEKYFGCTPFVLQAGVKTGLRIRYRNPLEVGADRIAAAIGAVQRHPGRALLIVDFGTATTLEVVTASGDYLGGVIMPGVGIAAESLASRTAKLPRIETVRPEAALGRSTTESIQSGIFHGHCGAVRHLVDQLRQECFPAEHPVVLATGGYAAMFQAEGLFDELVPELVLLGLKFAADLNHEA